MRRKAWIAAGSGLLVSLVVGCSLVHAEELALAEAEVLVPPPTVPINLSIHQTRPEQEEDEAVQTVEINSMRYHAWLANFIRNYNKRIGWDQANLMARSILEFSQRYNVDFRLVTGLIAVESSFRHDVVSSSGAIGLGQLKPATAKWMGVVNPYDPVDNIAGTTRFLSWLLRKYNGSLDHALSAYYQGPGHVDRNGITPVCMPYLHKINKVLSMMM